MQENQNSKNTPSKSKPKPSDDDIFSDGENIAEKRPFDDTEQFDHKHKRVRTTKKEDEAHKHPKIEALQKLALSYKTNNPSACIEFRHDERKAIVEMLLNSIKRAEDDDTSNNCMIIIGQPGLGKTMLLTEIAAELNKGDRVSYFKECVEGIENEVSLLKKKKWKIHFYNAVMFSNVSDLLRDIANNVFGHKLTKLDVNAEFILKLIKADMDILLMDHYLIIMIDELEYLLNTDKRDFNALVTFLNMKDTGFVKFAISNTLDIIGHVSGTTQALQFNFLCCKPYDKNKLKGIILARTDDVLKKFDLERTSVLADSAIDYIVKNNFSNHSSDVRLLLAVCNGVVETKVEELKKLVAEKKEIVTTDLLISIPNVIDYVLRNAMRMQMEVIQRLSIHSQLLLLTICMAMSKHGHVLKLAGIAKDYKKVLGVYEMETDIELQDQLSILKSYNLIDFGSKSGDTIRVMMTKQELDRCFVGMEGFVDYRSRLQ